MERDARKIYNKIIQYYDISEQLIEEIRTADKIDPIKKEDVLMPIAITIKQTADALIDSYIIYIKNKNDKSLKQNIIKMLDKLLDEISVCKNKIYSLYLN